MKPGEGIRAAEVRFQTGQDEPWRVRHRARPVQFSYMPVLRHMRAEYGDGEVAYIPIERVMYWTPAKQ